MAPVSVLRRMAALFERRRGVAVVAVVAINPSAANGQTPGTP
jgi:hypothetical protein